MNDKDRKQAVQKDGYFLVPLGARYGPAAWMGAWTGLNKSLFQMVDTRKEPIDMADDKKEKEGPKESQGQLTALEKSRFAVLRPGSRLKQVMQENMAFGETFTEGQRYLLKFKAVPVEGAVQTVKFSLEMQYEPQH